MKSQLVYLRPLRLTCVRAVGPYAQSSEEAWTRLFEWLSDNGLHAFPGCGYGLVLDDQRVTDPSSCRYEACIELNENVECRAEGVLASRKLPAGAYLRQRHVGCYKEMRHQSLNLRDNWPKESGLAIDNKRPLVQIFLDDPRREQLADLRSDICIPVVAPMPPSQPGDGIMN